MKIRFFFSCKELFIWKSKVAYKEEETETKTKRIFYLLDHSPLTRVGSGQSQKPDKLLISISLDTYSEVKFLKNMELLVLVFRGNPVLFSIQPVPVYIPDKSIRDVSTPYQCPLSFSVPAIMTPARWYLPVALTGIFLVISDAECPFMNRWVFSSGGISVQFLHHY